MASIDGTSGDDTLNGGIADDTILGYGGRDTISSASGDDTVYGGSDDDLIMTGVGDDSAEGGDGRDRIFAGDGNDTISGGADDDLLFGEKGADTLYGGAGRDNLYGGSGDDHLEGGSGDDFLFGEAGDDSIIGGAGDDSIEGGQGADSIDGGAGNDEIEGGSGDDTIAGGAGNDEIRGETGDDTITGGSGDDTLYGEQGNDSLDGGDGTDTVQGDEGDDILVGSAGDDTLYGGQGADTLYGGSGDDSLQGASGDDQLFGGIGADTLLGAEGTDDLTGGTGADVFVVLDGTFDTTITDFSIEDTDQICLILAEITEYSDITSRMTEVMGNTLITFDNGSTLTVQGILPNQMSESDFIIYGGPVCFAAGTTIQTPTGAQYVEHLSRGDTVITRDHHAQKIRHISHRRYRFLGSDPHMKPIQIGQNALSPGVPSQPLVVSPQHRLLLEDPATGKEVLVPAAKLLGRPGIRRMYGKRQVEYYHILLDRHEVLLANGAPAESLLISDYSIKNLRLPKPLMHPNDPARRPARPLLGKDPFQGKHSKNRAIFVSPNQSLPKKLVKSMQTATHA